MGLVFCVKESFRFVSILGSQRSLFPRLVIPAPKNCVSKKEPELPSHNVFRYEPKETGVMSVTVL